MTLLLNQSEVGSLLSLADAMRVTEEALREQAAGRAATTAPMHVTLEGEGALRVVSGALGETGRSGVKVNPVSIDGKACAMLFDKASGDLLSVMGYPFGPMRTAAVFGVATDKLASTDARTLAMIGTGRNASGLLRAACAVRPIELIRVHGRDPERRSELARETEDDLGVSTVAAASVAEAVDGADMIYVSTSSATSVLTAEETQDSGLVVSMGTPTELDGSVYLAAARVYVTARAHEQGYRDIWPGLGHTLLELDAAGTLPWASVGELCDVVAGDAAADVNGGPAVVRESQGGYGDVALANWVYTEARARNVGTEYGFM